MIAKFVVDLLRSLITGDQIKVQQELIDCSDTLSVSGLEVMVRCMI